MLSSKRMKGGGRMAPLTGVFHVLGDAGDDDLAIASNSVHLNLLGVCRSDMK